MMCTHCVLDCSDKNCPILTEIDLVVKPPFRQIKPTFLDKGGNGFGHKCAFGQSIFHMNPVQGLGRVAVVRYVFQI